uniref:Cx9C motif-containing protein 4 n=1 Tax=Tetranychus urticae TaxID=32264 RepID=T1KRN0_TETUR
MVNNRSSKDPCKKYACLIQTCLKSNNFNEEACAYAIDDMKDCCRTWNFRSDCCDGFLRELGFKSQNQ